MKNTLLLVICILLNAILITSIFANSTDGLLMPDPPIAVDIDVCEGESTEIIPMATGGVTGGGTIVVYEETFDTDGEGVAGSCASGTCATDNPPANGQWSITGDFTGITATTDFAITSGGLLEFQDTDGEVCFTSSVIDISGCSESSVSIDLSAFGDMEAQDYLDVILVIDGIPLPELNFNGLGSPVHTFVDNFGTATFTSMNIIGSTFQVVVCALNNAGAEQYAIDNIVVDCILPLSGPITFKYYDVDPITGASPIFGPTMGSFDPMITPGTTDDIWITACDVTGESAATMITITVNEIPAAPIAMGGTFCDGDAIPDVVPSGEAGAIFTFYSDAALTTVLQVGPSYTPTGMVGIEEIFITQSVNGCESEAAMITITVNEIPAAPMAMGGTFCDGDAIPDVVPTGEAGATFTFYSDAALTTVLQMGPSYTPMGMVGIETVFITQTVNGCESSAIMVTVTVFPLPSAPIVMDITVCDGESTEISPQGGMGGGGSTASVIYAETFDTDGEGVAGNCTSSAPGSCATNVPPANGQWLITGNVNSLTATSDFALTSGGMLEFQDTDTVVCFTSTLIDISGCITSDFMIDISESGALESADFVDVNLIIDGVSNPIPNWLGLGDANHTLVDDFTSTTVSQTGITGSSLVVEVCVLNNAGTEQIFLDNIIVGCEASNSGVTLFKYFDADPATGAAPIAGPTAMAFDPMTAVGEMEMIWVTACEGVCESEATKVTITVNEIPGAPMAMGGTFCDGDAIPDVVPSGEAGAIFTFYSDAALTTVLQVGPSYTPTGIVGIEEIFITQSVNGCESEAAEVMIEVIPTPTAPMAADVNICLGEALIDVMTIGEPGATITYYADAALTNVIGAGPIYTPMGTPGVEIVFVTQEVDGCESAATEVSISIAGFENITTVPTCNTGVLDYCLDISFDFAGPGPSNMYEVIVNGIVFGPFAYGATGTEMLTVCDPVNFIGDEQMGLAVEIADVDRGNLTEGISQTGGGVTDPEGCIEIASVMAAQNADNNGDGVIDFCDEFVTLTNGGTAILNISGYTISDAIAVRHIFPVGTIINPAQTIILFNSDLSQVATCATSGIWNNGGDDIVLIDAAGALVDMETYTGSTIGVAETFEVVGCGMGTTINNGPSACVQVNSVLANQIADNNGDGLLDFCDEFISIVNPGTVPLDISGYSISDAAALRHIFPAGSTLNPGQVLIVFNSDLSQLANCAGSGIWNNGGDDVVISDAAGMIVDSETYGSSQAGVEFLFSVDNCPPLEINSMGLGICSGIVNFDEPNCCPVIEVSSFMGMSLCAGSCPAVGQGLMATGECGAIAPNAETKWFADPAGLFLIFEGDVFDPIGEGFVDNDIAGETIFYAQVSCAFCLSELIPVTLEIFECDPPNDGCGGCTYFVQLYDSGFDGWDGARFLVSLNDGPFVEYKLTASDNGFLTFPIEIIDGGTIDYMYMEGNNAEEHSFKILNAFGETVATEGMQFTGSNIVAGVEESIKVDCPVCCVDASEQFTFVFTAGMDAVEKSWELRDSEGSRVAFANAGEYAGLFTGQSVSSTLTLDPCEEYTIVTFSARNNGWEGGTYQIFSDNAERGTFVSLELYLIADGPATFTDQLESAFTLPCGLDCPAEETILADDLNNCILNSYTASLIDAPVCFPNNCHFNPLPTLEVCYPTAIGGLVQGSLGMTSASLPVGSNPVVYKVTYGDGQIIRCTSQVHVISEINPVLACNDFVIVPLLASTVECETIITADMILENPSPCNAQYFIELEDANGNAMGNVVNFSDAGQVFTYSITQIGTGLSSLCEGQIQIEDKVGPSINCVDYEVNCNHPEALNALYTHTEVFPVEAGELPGNIAGGTTMNPSELFLPIPDVGCGPFGEIIQDVNVSINLVHNDVEDLTILLVAPNGTVITLLERRTCNNQGSQNINVTFDSEAITPVFAACVPGIPGLTGTLQPAQPLSLLYNLPYSDFQGDWTLVVRDDDDSAFEGIGVGEVISASLEIQAGFPFPYAATDCNLQSVSLISEVVVETDCDQGEWLGSKIVRVWKAEDAFGNTTECTQTVGLKAPMLTQIDVPADVELECGSVPSDPVLITPEIGGISFFECFELNDSQQNLCDIIITYEDEVFLSCGNGYKIFRTWEVLNWCSGTSLSHVQAILVTDNFGPEITLNDIIIGTNEEACTANVALEDLNVMDACSEVTDVSASYLNDGNLIIVNFTNGETLTNLPIGTTVVTIIATDECLNTTSEDVTINVVDDVNPTASCNNGLNISLSNTGVGELSAVEFDEGSNDNCSAVTVLIRSLGCEGGPFAEVANFACCDVGSVVVELLVTDAVGNTNICWADVLVEDVSTPTITCQPDVTINCDDGLHAEDLFLTPDVNDNCNTSITEEEMVEVALPNCGVLLIKTYTVSDGSEKSDDVSCTQTVTIVHASDFIVQFPPDLIFEDCPEDLATIPGPIVTEDECEQIGISVVDRIFTQVEDACYKIERTYTVINHCIVGDPSLGGFTDLGTPLPIPRTFRDDDGYFQYTQIIKVQDQDAPVITFTAPDPCDFSDACEAEFVLTATGEDACSAIAALDYSWKIDIAGDGTFDFEGVGADATGTYPYGDHLIKWTVSDGCGNQSAEAFAFSIEDCKNPTPKCQGITTVVMNNGNCVEIQASELLIGAEDNCTIRTDEEWKANASVRLVGDNGALTTELQLCCGDLFLNNINVEVWIEDEAGNAEFCIVVIDLQDNMGNCSDVGTGFSRLIGSTKTEMGDAVDEVEVNINGAEIGLTNEQGSFNFILDNEESYQIAPVKKDGAAKGISTFDLVLMAQHVLQINLLDSPYKLIAADVNLDGRIDIFDLVEQRQLILFQIQNFSIADSWIFIPAEYEFQNPSASYAEDYPVYLDIDLQDDYVNADFVAIKMGDLDLSAARPLFNSVEERNFPQTLEFVLEDTKLKAGTTFELRFKADDFTEISGYQFTLAFDPSALEVNNMSPGALNVDQANFGQTLLDKGMLTSSFNVMDESISVKDGETLFSLSIYAKRDVKLSESFQVVPQYTLAEAYKSTHEVIGLDIRFASDKESSQANFVLDQNTPNPFKHQTEIGFSLPSASFATLRIYDVTGKMLFQVQDHYPGGYNKVQIDAEKLGESGLLYYILETKTNHAERKMILLE